MIELETLEGNGPAPAICPLHPRYRVIWPPRSKHPDCICQEIWDAKWPEQYHPRQDPYDV